MAALLILCVAWGVQFVGVVEAVDQSDQLDRIEAGRHSVDDDSGRASVDAEEVELADGPETKVVKRAHHETDSKSGPSGHIEQVAWPWSNGPDQIRSTDTSEPRRRLFAKPIKTSRPRDPFAENENSAKEFPNKSLAESTADKPKSQDTAHRRSIAASRQRVIEYQSRANKPLQTSNRAKPASSSPAAPNMPLESHVMTSSTPQSVESPQTEEQLRALFETTVAPPIPSIQPPSSIVPTSVESPLNAVAAIETRKPDVPESAANRPVTKIQAETELPLETLQFRARQAQQNGRLESARQLRLAAERSNASRQPIPVQPLKATQPAVPQHVRAPSEPGRARVDQIRDEVKAPSEPRMSGTAVPANEPIIRPAHRSTEMPAPQVLANRAIQLPAPAGWSAATKIEANRREIAISSTSVTNTAFSASTVNSNHGIELALGQHDIAPTDQPAVHANHAQPLQQPVSLGRIEDEVAAQLQANQEDVIDSSQAESYTSKSPASVREPARIPVAEPVLNPEPISEPLLASAQPPRWVMYAITAAGVLFGLYGMSRSNQPSRKISI